MSKANSSLEVLFVDDEEHLRFAAAQTFELAEINARQVAAADYVLEWITRDFPGIIVSDIRMPKTDGMQLLQKVLDIDFELPVILITGHGDVQLAVEAMRSGAYDFIEKPFAPAHLVEVVRRALDKRRLTLENRELRSNLTNRDGLEVRLAGRSQVMEDLRASIRCIAPTELDVLIVGDTGCGKEVVARALHTLSGRAEHTFVAINCGAIPPERMESELFGHEAGAFPGALRARCGKFEHGRGGTVFLDEIQSMSPDMQVKLLRIIEERTITRLGSNEPIALDTRFVAASKANLEREVEQGRFRQDLYYRLNGITLKVPSLSERKEDLPGLFIQLANEAARKYRRDYRDIPPGVLSEMSARDWPGNVRQLKNAAERYVLGIGSITGTANMSASGTLSERMAEYEKSIIASELSAQNGVLKATYEALGISRKSLYEKMQKYGLDRSRFAADS